MTLPPVTSPPETLPLGPPDPPPPAKTAPLSPKAAAGGEGRFDFLDRAAAQPAAQPLPRPGSSPPPPEPATGPALPPRTAAPPLSAALPADRLREPPATPLATSRHADGPLKTRFALAIVLLALVSALPVGSNRPLAWACLACLIGLIGAAYMLATQQRSPDAPLRLAPFAALLGLAALQPLWGLVQTLPLGGLAQGLALPADLPEALRPRTLSLDPRASLLAALRMATHICFFALALDLMTRPDRVLRALSWLFIGITLTAAYGMTALTVLGDIGPWGAKRYYLGFATGPFVNRNSFASFLGMGLVIGLALVMELRSRPKMRRQRRHGFLTEDGLRYALHGVALGLIFATLLATGSRMGLLASLSGGAVTLWLMQRASGPAAPASIAAPPIAAPPPPAAGRWAMARALLPLALVLALVSPFLAIPLERSLFAKADFPIRLSIFADSVARIAERPLLGYGLDAFPLAFELGRSGGGLDARIYTDAHSTYLENWVEGGLIFGSVPLVAAGIYVGRLRRALRLRRGHSVSSAAAAGVLTLAALHSLVDFSFEIEANVLILCLICAMGIAEQSRRKPAP